MWENLRNQVMFAALLIFFQGKFTFIYDLEKITFTIYSQEYFCTDKPIKYWTFLILEGSALIDKTIEVFDTLMNKVHQKEVENAKAHFAGIRKELVSSAVSLTEEINKLS